MAFLGVTKEISFKSKEWSKKTPGFKAFLANWQEVPESAHSLDTELVRKLIRETQFPVHILTILFLFIGLNFVHAQSIDRYFLGIPFQSPNKVQIDRLKSDSRFRPSYKSDYPEWVFFDAEFLDNRAIDPDCDSIRVILTSGSGNFTNLDRTTIIYFYQSRSIQIEKYYDLEMQLKYNYRNYDYISGDDISNLSQNKLNGIICFLTSEYYPNITLFQTTDENLFALILEYSQANEK